MYFYSSSKLTITDDCGSIIPKDISRVSCIPSPIPKLATLSPLENLVVKLTSYTYFLVNDPYIL